MCSETSTEGWDLTPVFDLINSLTTSVEYTAHADSTLKDHLDPSSIPVLLAKNHHDHDTRSGLGNFDNLWRYLGQPSTKDPSHLENLEEHDLIGAPTRESNIEPVSSKGVRWRDEIEGAKLTETDEVARNLTIPSFTKTQRKKERRRKLREEGFQGRVDVKPIPSGSENDSELDLERARCSHDRKVIIEDILYGKARQIEKPNKSILRNLRRPQSLSDQETWPTVKPRSLSGTLAALFSPEQTAYATAADKKARLVNKLSTKFIQERQFLDTLGLPTPVKNGDSTAEVGIHVFVDASNILIGFHDALMISRGLSIRSRIRRQPLSFHSLSLILERGRPTAKRVLVGSDNFPAVQEAKVIGYETNILERVHKAKELTSRQKKYSNSNGNNKQTGYSSGSETGVGIFAPEKWVEQAVDEILHLKILESIVDAKVPSTIVLATGDAAEAEYSQGFLKMVERALEKGWMVELVSFKHNTSGAYRRKGFRTRWGEKFKTVELDEFVEELLGA